MERSQGKFLRRRGLDLSLGARLQVSQIYKVREGHSVQGEKDA